MGKKTRNTQRRSNVAEPDGSWVFEDASEESEYQSDLSDLEERHPPQRTSTSTIHDRNKASAFTSTAGPEFVMPSMADDMLRSRRRLRSNEDGQRAAPPAYKTTARKRHGTKSSSSDMDENVRLYARLLWTDLLSPTIRFFYTVASWVLLVIKPILAIALVIWIVIFLLKLMVSSAFVRSVAPICAIPGISSLNLPICAITNAPGPAEFQELVTVQSAFEDVLASSAEGITLPLDMKRSESSIRDLKHVVQFSSLPSRGELVFEFAGFIETARQAASDLTKFNSRIGRAVDNVLSTNRWTLQVLDGVSEQQGSRGAIGQYVQDTILAPFRSMRLTEGIVLDQYLKHTRAIEEQIAELIVEAQLLLGILQNLDDRLDVIHGITARDGVTVQGGKNELLAQLWTWVGGNRSSMKKHNEQLSLLKSVSVYRETAWEHVSGTILKLNAIAAGLEDLRERVAAPDVLGHRSDIPLRMHIEHIQMGVERLEEQRAQTRKIEQENMRNVFDRKERLSLE